MSQTRLGSFIEAWANILVGFTISYIANIVVLRSFGYAVTAGDAFWIGVVFTLISLVRSYVIRRWFNGFKFDKENKPC